MTTFICFIIAMVIIYIMMLFTNGFDITTLLSFLIMFILLGAHVYLVTRKKVIWGIVVPLLILISFYPVYKLLNPVGITLIVLVGLYAIAFGCCLYIWYRARKSKD